MEILRSKLFSKYPQIVFGMSTKDGGVSPPPYYLNLSISVGDDQENVRENRRRFFTSLGIDHSQLAFPLQIHSSTVQYADKPGRYSQTDALVSDKQDVYLIVTVADCLPVFLFDPVRRVIAGIHAGWKGSSNNITRKVIQYMNERWSTDPADIIVYMGPSAGVCCYEVGEEVAQLFPLEHTVPQSNGKYHLDIPSFNLSELLGSGVLRKNIEHDDSCTICTPSSFHSYRRDGKKSGRMMGVLGVKNLKRT